MQVDLKHVESNDDRLATHIKNMYNLSTISIGNSKHEDAQAQTKKLNACM